MKCIGVFNSQNIPYHMNKKEQPFFMIVLHQSGLGGIEATSIQPFHTRLYKLFFGGLTEHQPHLHHLVLRNKEKLLGCSVPKSLASRLTHAAIAYS